MCSAQRVDTCPAIQCTDRLTAAHSKLPFNLMGVQRKTLENGDCEVGTPGRYNVHRRHGETPCEPCRLAKNKANREWQAANPKKVRKTSRGVYERRYEALQARIKLQGGRLLGDVNTCAELFGTDGGAQRHYWAAEEYCYDCRLADNERQRAMKNASKAKQKTLRPNSIAVAHTE